MSPALASVAAPRRAPRHAPAPAPRRPHLRVVPQGPPPRAPRADRAAAPRAGRGMAALIAAGVLFAVLFAVAVLQTQNVAGQVHLDDVQQSISDRQAEAQSLRLAAADLAAPQRIVDAAEAMGMAAPSGGPTYVNQVPAGDPATATDPSAIDPSELAAPEAEISLDETAAGLTGAGATP